jgi:PhnB protein
MANVKPIPDGYHSVTPYLCVKGAAEAIEFYKKAFGAEEVLRMPSPDGRIAHAEVRIGNSIVMMADEFPEMGPGARSPKTAGFPTGGVMLYTENCDALTERAVKAGATVTMPLQDMFWGDRYGQVEDPFGHRWSIATHKEDVSPEEMGRRQQAWAAKMAEQHGKK